MVSSAWRVERDSSAPRRSSSARRLSSVVSSSVFAAVCSCSTRCAFLSAIAAANDSVPARSSSGGSVRAFVDPGAEQEDRQPLDAGVERDHQLGRGRRQRGERDVLRAGGPGAGRQHGVQQRPWDGCRPDPLVERAEDARLVGVPGGAQEAGPPGEEHLGHEIEDELLGFRGGVHRTEQPGHLPERAELEGGVVERRLALHQHAAHLATTESPWASGSATLRSRSASSGARADDDLRLAAPNPRDRDGPGLPPGPGRSRGAALERRRDVEPDGGGVEPADERVAAAFEELRVVAGQPAWLPRRRWGELPIAEAATE